MSTPDIVSASVKNDVEQISSGSMKSVQVNNNEKLSTVRPQTARQISEWEAMQIAEAGDFETIDTEVNELDAQLQYRKKSRWGCLELSFEDPKYFTWLLVGFASMVLLLTYCSPS